MLKQLIIIISIVLLSVPVYAQAPDTLWTRTYGGEQSDCGFGVQQTDDGGFIIIGKTNSNSAGMSDIYLIKTDANGDTLWTRKYGGEFADCGRFVLQTDDSGYILVCAYGLTSSNVCLQLIKTNENGDTLWTRTHPDYSVYNYIQQTEDGGYIIAGSSQQDAALLKTDAYGEIEWQQTYGDPEIDCGYSVQLTDDGGYIMCGSISTNFVYGLFDVYLVKTNAVGDTVWTRSIGDDCVDIGYCVQVDPDGGYIITGMFNGEHGADIYSDVYLIKVDVNGDTLWTRSYGRDINDWGSYVVNTTDGGYVITGTCDLAYYSGYDGDLYLLKVNGDGDEEWNISFGGVEQDHGECVQQTADGGYIVVGSTFYSSAGLYDVWLLRFESEATIVEELGSHPSSFILHPCIPNPFNAETIISFELRAASCVKLAVYDIEGREVARLIDDWQSAGTHQTTFNAEALPSGIYFARLAAGDFQQTRKMLLIK